MVLLESVLSFFLLSVCLIDGEVVPEESTVAVLEASNLAITPSLPEGAERGLQISIKPDSFFKRLSTHIVNFLNNIIVAPPKYGCFGFIKMLFAEPVVFLRNFYTQFVILVRNVLTPYVPSNFIAFLTRLLPRPPPSNGDVAMSPEPAPSDGIVIPQPKGFIGFLWRIVVFLSSIIRKISTIFLGKFGRMGLRILGELIYQGFYMLLTFLPWPLGPIVKIILSRIDDCPYFDHVHPLIVFVSQSAQCVVNSLGRIWTLLKHLIQTELNSFCKNGLGTFMGVVNHVIAISVKIIKVLLQEILRFVPCVGLKALNVGWTGFRCLVRLPF